jgi:hypothetical protein
VELYFNTNQHEKTLDYILSNFFLLDLASVEIMSETLMDTLIPYRQKTRLLAEANPDKWALCQKKAKASMEHPELQNQFEVRNYAKNAKEFFGSIRISPQLLG